MCVVLPAPVALYIPCKQMMYFILIYLTEHITLKEQSLGGSEEVDVIIDSKSIHRTDEEKYEENLHSLVLIKFREEVSRLIRREVNRVLKWKNS